jgi:hypothetical protein
MAKTKTKATGASVEAYLDAIKDEVRRKDCDFLVKLMKKITGQPPKMWGPSIVGFDSYHYRYESGHEGDACVAGFSSRKPDLTVYVLASGPGQEELLSRLGKHKMGKACLYIRRLSDVDTKVLERLISGSVAEVKRRYG